MTASALDATACRSFLLETCRGAYRHHESVPERRRGPATARQRAATAPGDATHGIFRLHTTRRCCAHFRHERTAIARPRRAQRAGQQQ